MKRDRAAAEVPIDAKKSYDITVHDIVGPDFTVRFGADPLKDKGKDKDFFSLLQYSFNLTPALREEISKDVSNMITEREPHIVQKEDDVAMALSQSSIERKSSFVLKPPLQSRPLPEARARSLPAPPPTPPRSAVRSIAFGDPLPRPPRPSS